MVESRLRPGFLFFQSCVYLFGGRDEGDRPLRSCESLLSRSLQWKSFSPMLTARAEFNPCLLGSLIYLCGGFTYELEQYDPVADAYTCLGTAYSGAYYSSSTCAVIEDGNLTILYRNDLWRLDLERKKLGLYEGHMGEVWSCTTPILCEGKLYLTSIEGQAKCRAIDLKAPKFRCLMSISNSVYVKISDYR